MTYEAAKFFRANLSAERDRLEALGDEAFNDFLACKAAIRNLEERIIRKFSAEARAEKQAAHNLLRASMKRAA